jgi:hypothetical protein
MSDADFQQNERIRIAKATARELGYTLWTEEALNLAPLTHMAIAAPYIANQASMGRFLTYSTSASEAAEAGLEVLRGIAQSGDPWPEND